MSQTDILSIILDSNGFIDSWEYAPNHYAPKHYVFTSYVSW